MSTGSTTATTTRPPTATAKTQPERLEPAPGTDTIVIRSGTGGGFDPPQVRFRDVSGLKLYGDGQMFFGTGAFNNAISFIGVRQVTPAGIRLLLKDAADAGMLADAPDYGEPQVTDLGTVALSFATAGGSFDHFAYALGVADDLLTPDQQAARQRLSSYLKVLYSASSRHASEIGPEVPYRWLGVDVLIEESTKAPTKPWPLGDLSAAVSVPDSPGRCTTFRGADASILQDAVAGLQESDVWSSEAAAYELSFRPLLPNEHGCLEK